MTSVRAMSLSSLFAFQTPFIPSSPLSSKHYLTLAISPRSPSFRCTSRRHIVTNELTPSDPSERPKPTPKFLRNASKGALSNVSTASAVISWYPGHIAKAERALKSSIKLVDVIIEVRDSRIPFSTAHPSVEEWVGIRPRVLALTRADLAPPSARAAWRDYYHRLDTPVRFVDARRGRGVSELKKLAVQAGAAVNDKRKRRGLLPRPVRCLVMGYPNVGKSALINKLVGRKSAKSANKPGVTRNFQWIRISDSIELLDMPGIIPAKFISQDKATRLAICDDIGQAAYDYQIVAALMVDELKRVVETNPSYFDMSVLESRFGVNVSNISGEEFLHEAAERVSKGNLERTAVRLLTEFRSGMLGPVALESPEMMGKTAMDSSREE